MTNVQTLSQSVAAAQAKAMQLGGVYFVMANNVSGTMVVPQKWATVSAGFGQKVATVTATSVRYAS